MKANGIVIIRLGGYIILYLMTVDYECYFDTFWNTQGIRPWTGMYQKKQSYLFCVHGL